MATSRVLSRLSNCLPSIAPTSNASKSALPKISRLKSISQAQVSSSLKRINRPARLPVELSCLLSMVPLHSTTASARLRSLLPIESQNWGLVPQVLVLLAMMAIAMDYSHDWSGRIYGQCWYIYAFMIASLCHRLLHEEFDVALKCVFLLNYNVLLNVDKVQKP